MLPPPTIDNNSTPNWKTNVIDNPLATPTEILTALTEARASITTLAAICKAIAGEARGLAGSAEAIRGGASHHDALLAHAAACVDLAAIARRAADAH